MNRPNPLGAITIRSLADIGYRVDVTQAGAYTVPPPSSKIARAPEQLILLDCVVTHPKAWPTDPSRSS